MSVPFSSTRRSLKLSAGRGYSLWLAAVVLLLAAWGWWFVTAEIHVFELSRQARLEASTAPHALIAPQSGKLARTTLAVGRSVRAGEVLAALDSANEQWLLEEELARLRAIEPRLSAIAAEIGAQERALGAVAEAAAAAQSTAAARARESAAAVDFARESERRLSDESRVGSVAGIEALRARSELERLSASREAQSADAGRLAAETRARQAQSVAQLESLRRQAIALRSDEAVATASIARLRAAIERRSIVAPMDGVVGEAQALNPGVYVAEGQRLATIVPQTALRVVAQFNPASSIGRIRVGQPAQLRLDGFPWAQFGTIKARVTNVATEIRDQSLLVELGVVEVNPLIPVQHGLAGQLEVTIERASPAALLLRTMGRGASPAPVAVAQQAVANGRRP